MFRIVSTFLLFTILLLYSVCFGGCRFTQPIVDAIFQPPASNDDPIESGKESLYDAVKGSNWLVTFSILGMAAGVFALMNGSKIGIPAIVSCGAALFMSLAVARFATWMAVCGFVGALATVVLSILVKQRALKEVISNVQDIKNTAKLDNVDIVFQDKIKETLASQTKATKKLIAKVKKRLVKQDEMP